MGKDSFCNPSVERFHLLFLTACASFFATAQLLAPRIGLKPLRAAALRFLSRRRSTGAGG